jgi:hypothetical protein
MMILPFGMGTQKTYAASTAAGVEISPVLNSTSYRYLLVGESYDFNIKNKIPGSTYTWKSSNTKIATVDKKGLVKAKSAGTVKVVCNINVNGKTYRLVADVYVKKSPKNPAGEVKIINKTNTLVVGEKYNLNKSYVPDNATDNINWTSSNTNIATVDKNGFVTGIKTGEVVITATTLSKKVTDSVKITVTNTAIVSDQSQLEKALSGKASSIKIKTDKAVEFNIPEGNYADKKLIVDAPKSSVSNHGLFSEITITAIKPDTWHEYASGNIIIIEAANSRIIIEASASAEVHITESGANTVFEIIGGLNLYVEAAGNIDITGASGVVPRVTISNTGALIRTELALNIEANQQATIELNSAEASKTTIKVNSKDNIPIVTGTGSITVIVNGVSQIVGSNQGNTGNTPTATPTTPPTATPTTAPTPTAGPSPTPVIPDKITATFGSPYVDGVIDDCWEDAGVIVPGIYSAASDVKVKHRIMWDDNALYFLTEVQDSNLDKVNTTSYQQDSVEYFLDELYDKASGYQPDDLHYRVNFENMRTTDSGDSKRFYTRTQLTKDASGATTGYIAEACIVWADATAPANGLEMGADLQINEAKNGSRAATITVFDTTGNAFQYPNVFGKLVLEGKGPGAVSGVNPYPLLTLIDIVKNMYLDAYINKGIIDAPLAAAEATATDQNATQQQLDDAYAVLLAAINTLDDGSGYTKPSALPETDMTDPFTFLDGSSVTTLADWEARQQEISGLYQYYMYGMKRSGENVRYEFINSYTTWVFDWATWSMVERTVTPGPDQKFIKIFVEKGGEEVSFIATATFPSTTDGNDVVTIADPLHSGGHPVLVSIGSLGASQKKYLNDNGYAVIEFTYTDIASDDLNRNGIFYQLYPYGRTYDEQTGVLMAWAWGVSKVIDAVAADAAGANAMKIDPANTMVTGVSRCGKAAAIAGAFDSRIKVTVPASSGTSGVASFRYLSAGKTYDYSSLEKAEFIDFSGETAGTAKWQSYQDNPLYTVGSNEQLSNSQGAPHWFNDNFLEFTSANQLPFDQHLLIALAADTDRYYFITGEVDGGDWINNAGMYASYLAAQNVYDSLGVSDNLAIHLHSTGHALTLEDTKYLVEFCNQKLYGQVDGRKDLNHVKTSIYELPVNYDPYFNVLKSMDGPDLAGNTLFSETFDSGIGNYVASVSGAAISIRTIGGNNVLNVTPAGEDSYVVIPLAVSGSAISVSGSAIAVSGSAISVSGGAITISVAMMYDEDPAVNVSFQMGIIEVSGAGEQDVILETKVEAAVGQNKGIWVVLTATYTMTDKDTLLYLKGFNTSSYNIDNIVIKRR